MDIATLKTFLTVAQLQSYTRAAKQLHLTPSAISKRIGRLEAELEAQLFNQIGQNTKLTEIGKKLLPFANEMVVIASDSIKAIKELNERISGTIFLGVTFFPGLYRLPKILKAFLLEYPDVNFDVKYLFAHELHEEILAAHLDFGITTTIPLISPHIQAMELWKEEFHVFVEKSHPLATCKQLTTQMLAKYPAILPAPGYAIRDSVDRLFLAANERLLIKMDMNNLDVVKELVALGLGWTVLSTDFVTSDLVQLDYPDFPIAHSYYLIHHKEKRYSLTEKKFIDFFREFDLSSHLCTKNSSITKLKSELHRGE